ncbi:MAG: AMMECR1 domain-containing protein, partial [Nitrososphaera sp.]
MNLSDEDCVELVKLARNALENYLEKNVKITVPNDIASKYNEKAGLFVTLNSYRRKVEELRGCI